jgi:hypothetical protein
VVADIQRQVASATAALAPVQELIPV